MSAAIIAIRIEQNSTFRMKVTLRGPRPSPNVLGPRRDLTNTVFTGQVRKSYKETDPVVAEFEFEISNQAVEETKGEFYLVVDADITADIPATKETTYFYDIYSQPIGGERLREIQGTVTVSPSATKNE